jgi:uncharacterized membrane-anchored protein
MNRLHIQHAPTLLLTLALLSGSHASGQETSQEEFLSLADFAASLSFKEGSVKIAGGAAEVELPPGWAYLEQADARRVVEDLWGNPPGNSVLGLIDPPDAAGRLEAPFGILVELEYEGFVKDGDAADLDWAELLRDMQADAQASNESRIAAGYPPVDLIGWAESPRYDATEKKLYWAKELAFGGEAEHILNYDVRILGRKGYLVLQAVSPIEASAVVHTAMQELLPRVRFTEGHRYSDFDPKLDKVAAYGIGGLVAGKVLAKVGLFAVLAKFGKVIIFGALALLVAVKRFVLGEQKPKTNQPG